MLEAGLPNITGNWGGDAIGNYISDSQSGAINRVKNSTGSYGSAPNSNYRAIDLKFDASLSNPIYGASSTVQPPSITLIPQMRY